jgi:hypothetical protein
MSEGISNLRFQISNGIKAPNNKHTSTREAPNFKSQTE